MDADETRPADGTVVRRGLLAAFGAAVMVKVTGGRAAAEHSSDDGLFHVGVLNDGGAGTNVETATNLTARTTLVASISGGANATLRVRNNGSGGAGIDGVGASPAGDGVRGFGGTMSGAVGADDGRGIVGTGGNATINGVNGGRGVDATGGSSQNQTGGGGVFGQGGASTSGTGGTGVEGRGGFGVFGSEGVVGFGGGSSGSQGNGVRGQTSSTGAAGVRGLNNSAGPGVQGSSSNVNGVGVLGQNTAGGLAGRFAGSVRVEGNLEVLGAKNAVIEMHDGTLGLVYCNESPEPYFEDFGRAELVRGAAIVDLDPAFAALIGDEDYMVFVTPEGSARGIHVARRSPTSFEVRAGRRASVSFTYRVVTRRKDIAGTRFARVADHSRSEVSS